MQIQCTEGPQEATNLYLTSNTFCAMCKQIYILFDQNQHLQHIFIYQLILIVPSLENIAVEEFSICSDDWWRRMKILVFDHEFKGEVSTNNNVDWVSRKQY